MDLGTKLAVFFFIASTAVSVTPQLQRPWLSVGAWVLTCGYAIALGYSHRSQLLASVAAHPLRSTLIVAGVVATMSTVAWWTFVVPYAVRASAASSGDPGPKSDQALSGKATQAAAPQPTSKPEAQQLIISAPQGIAIGGGTVTNPTVNNFVTPNTINFSDAELAALVRKASVAPGRLRISAAMYEPRASAMAAAICRALESAGWECAVTSTAMVEAEGLEMWASDLKSPSVLVLQRALADIGIDAPLVIMDESTHTQLDLRIARLTQYQNKFIKP
jgi:hypothetical protein